MALDQSISAQSTTAQPLTFKQKFTAYLDFSKFNVMMLVLMMTFLGYLMAQPLNTPVNLAHLFMTLLGTFFLGAGSTSLNQLQERDRDILMPRTRKRPLPSSRLNFFEACFFVFLTLGTGAIILWEVNPIVFYLGFMTVMTYNVGYTMWWKRNWAFGAIPGALPGALPILMGYAAIADRPFSNESLFIFLILFFWQMPHFWALAIRYKDDYRQAGFPVLPVVLGEERTIYHITLWTLGYIALALIGPVFLNSSPIYLLIAVPTSMKLIWELFHYIRSGKDRSWIRFFLWVNFSLLIYLAAAVTDRWSVFFWDLAF